MRRTVIAAILILGAALASGLELERDDIRLELHEDSSRFTLSLRTDEGWVPLFYAEDPRTSALDILENNRVHRMGDSGPFTLETEEMPDGARFVWNSPTLRVEQRFRFTRGVGSDRTNAVEMAVSVTNLGEQPALAGARLLVDTYLGERTNVHFITPGREAITREASLEPGPVNRYVASVATPGAQPGFQIMLSGEGITVPGSVIAANWKRLTDSTWEYEVNQDRNFNRLPYSVNDSALLVAYEPEQLETGGSVSVIARMGGLAPDGYLAPAIAEVTTGDNAILERLTDLVTEINDLIAREQIDAEHVARLQAELQSLTDLVRGR